MVRHKLTGEFLTKLIVIFIIYFFLGKLGLNLAFLNPSASAVWFGTGVAISALFLFGYRYWPAIFLGAFFVNLTTNGTLLTSLGIALGNTLEGFLGAYLIRKYAGGQKVLDRPKNVFLFLTISIIVGIISATIGVTTLSFAGFSDWSIYYSVWLTWLVGNVVSALVIFPLAVSWSNTHEREYYTGEESALIMSAVIIVTLLTFTQWSPIASARYPIPYLALIPLIWASLRLGHKGTGIAVVVTSTISIFGTISGFGPFSQLSPNEALVSLQLYRVVISLVGLTISSLVAMNRELARR